MTDGQRGDVDSALRRAVLLFRLLAVAWMAVMVVINLLTDEGARKLVVVASLLVAVGGAAWSARHLLSRRPLSTSFVVRDGLIALAVALSPQIARASDDYYGGYPMSAVVVVALAGGVRWGLAAAGVFAATQAVAVVSESPAGRSVSGWVSLTVMTGVVALVVAMAADFLRRAESRRSRAEEALEEERRRHAVEQARMGERVKVADDLHDSVLQTVRVVAQNADDPTRVRALARRQERELRNMIERMHGGRDGTAAALRQEASDIEDLHGVEVDVVAASDVELDDRTSELVKAAREAVVNAARHSGAPRVDVTLEVGPQRVAVVVRDRGRGFDAATVEGGHGLGSLRDRLRRLGGQVDVVSAPGQGTEVVLAMPRATA